MTTQAQAIAGAERQFGKLQTDLAVQRLQDEAMGRRSNIRIKDTGGAFNYLVGKIPRETIRGVQSLTSARQSAISGRISKFLKEKQIKAEKQMASLPKDVRRDMALQELKQADLMSKQKLMEKLGFKTPQTAIEKLIFKKPSDKIKTPQDLKVLGSLGKDGKKVKIDSKLDSGDIVSFGIGGIGDRKDDGVSVGLSDRDGRGFVSKLWSGVRDIFGSSTDIKKGEKQAKETYIDGLGFVSASQTGERATPFVRQPTPEEQKRIDEAEAIGSFEPLPEDIVPSGILGKGVRSAIDLGITGLSVYQKGEEKLSGSIKKWWGDRIEQFEDEIKKNPELFSEEVKSNIKGAREKLDTGKGLTILEQQLIDTPIKTVAELGVVGAINPSLLFGGVGASQQAEDIKEGLIKTGKYIEEKGVALREIPDIELLGKTRGDAQGIRNIGFATEILGKGVRGASVLVPETSEDLLTFALFEKGLKSKYIPKLIKSAGLKGLGGYEIYGGITGAGLTPEERYGKFLIGGLALAGSIPEDIVLARKLKFKLKGTQKTKTGEFGIQELMLDLGKTDINVKSPNELTMNIVEEPFKVEFIPSRSEVFAGRVDTLKILSEKVNLKEKPNLPKTNKIQSDILNIVKQNNDIISGSFAQKTLIKGSRDFKDLDILSKNPKELANIIKTKLGNEVSIKKKTIKDSPLGEFDIYKVYDKKGKHIADIDPIKFAEEGFASLFEPVKVKGYNLLPPEIRLVSKTLQQARPLPKGKRAKVLKDIEQIIGRKGLSTDPALLRGYGLTKAEQKALFDEKMLFLTHGGKGVIPSGEKVLLREGDFFSTPTILETGIAGARKSRMGFGKEQEYASFLDLINPKERANIEFYPKPKQVIIEKAKLEKGKIEVPDIPSTEIEVVRKVGEQGTELKIQKRYRTILEGEPVEIAFVKEVPKPKTKLSKAQKDKINKSKTLKDEVELNKFLRERQRGRTDKKLLRTPQRPKFRGDLPDNILRDPISDVRIPAKTPPRTPTRDIPKIPDTEIPRTPRRDAPRIPTKQPPRIPPRQPPRQPPTEPPRQPPRIRGEKKILPKKEKISPSYDVWIKPPKKKKYKKITKKPIALTDARNLRNFGIDQSTSRQGFLKPRENKPSPTQYDIPKNYAKDTMHKFRDYRVKKGKKIPLKRERVIELSRPRNYLLDTKNEKRQIDIFKLLAKREKKKIKKNQPVGLQFA